MDIHSVANMFPPMEQGDYEALKADIAARGLLEPVWTYNGAIVDGRHRYKACIELGIEPRTQEWNGNGSLVEFVVALNLRRRHLSASQKAVVALEIEAALAVEASERKERLGREAKLRYWHGDSEEAKVVSNLTQPLTDTGKARDQAAQIVGVASGYIAEAKRLQRDNPELLDKVRSGKLTLQDAKKVATLPETRRDSVIDTMAQGKDVKTAIKTVARLERETAKNATPDNWQASDAWQLYHGDVLTVGMALEANSVDCIITDPPYPKDYLSVYSDLSAVAAHVLKPNGFLVAMVGQSYLPEVMTRLGEHLTYHWTCCYLTLGGQSAQLWERNVNTFWKPVLWYTKGKYTGDWIGDVVKSDTNEKQHHAWQQSEGGILALMQRFVYPDMLVLDPFLGAGTTGIAALALHCRFIGIDTDSAAIETSTQRLRNFKAVNYD